MTKSGPPRIEMLWESDDPREVLPERFGYADEAAAERWVSRIVQQHWEIEVLSCERVVLSFHNALAWIRTPQGRMLAKWSISTGRFARLAALAEVTAWLDDQGLPVSAPVPTPDGRRQVEVDGVSIGLQRRIPGELLDVADREQVHAAGTTLARLHENLSAYPAAERFLHLAPRPETPHAQITRWLDGDHPGVPEPARDALRLRLTAVPTDALPTQLVHGDFRAANVLVDNGTVSAVLDFEDATIDHRIVELARSAVLIGTKFHDWGPVRPEVRAGLLAGYQSVCRLTPAEAAWWDALVLWFSLAMIPAGDDPTGWGDAAARLATTSAR